jgi:hypothetical protein
LLGGFGGGIVIERNLCRDRGPRAAARAGIFDRLLPGVCHRLRSRLELGFKIGGLLGQLGNPRALHHVPGSGSGFCVGELLLNVLELIGERCRAVLRLARGFVQAFPFLAEGFGLFGRRDQEVQ